MQESSWRKSLTAFHICTVEAMHIVTLNQITFFFLTSINQKFQIWALQPRWFIKRRLIDTVEPEDTWPQKFILSQKKLKQKNSLLATCLVSGWRYLTFCMDTNPSTIRNQVKIIQWVLPKMAYGINFGIFIHVWWSQPKNGRWLKDCFIPTLQKDGSGKTSKTVSGCSSHESPWMNTSPSCRGYLKTNE